MLASQLQAMGHSISYPTVARILVEAGYSLQPTAYRLIANPRKAVSTLIAMLNLNISIVKFINIKAAKTLSFQLTQRRKNLLATSKIADRNGDAAASLNVCVFTILPYPQRGRQYPTAFTI